MPTKEAKDLVCPHCKKSLINTGNKNLNCAISAPIPGKDGFTYGLCRCGFVMILQFDGEELIGITPTSNEQNEETNRQIVESYELFKAVNEGSSIFGYTKNGEHKNISDLRMNTIQFDVEEEAKSSTDAKLDKEIHLHEGPAPSKPVGFWRRLWNRFKGTRE